MGLQIRDRLDPILVRCLAADKNTLSVIGRRIVQPGDPELFLVGCFDSLIHLLRVSEKVHLQDG